jgi:branched-chain amino acid transport system permease protein
MAAATGVLFDGLAYGSLLFLISIGLAVTMGLMNFVNLAHGAFAMFGGYLAASLMNRAGVPFLVALLLAFIGAAILGLLLERLLYRRLYGASPLDQVLFSIGLVFISIATATYFFGPGQEPVALPPWLLGQFHVGDIDIGIYRTFLIAAVAVIAVGLWFLIVHTRLGSWVRAAVDHRDAAEGLGIPVAAVFTVTFAIGSGLAGLGGALGVDVLGLDPNFPLKYMVYFLLVVAVGGSGSLRGPLIAALLLGVIDVAGKYYVPQLGAFVIYALMVVLLLAFPQGLVRRRS